MIGSVFSHLLLYHGLLHSESLSRKREGEKMLLSNNIFSHIITTGPVERFAVSKWDSHPTLGLHGKVLEYHIISIAVPWTKS